jgi:hypothetical protein
MSMAGAKVDLRKDRRSARLDASGLRLEDVETQEGRRLVAAAPAPPSGPSRQARAHERLIGQLAACSK